MGAPCPTSSSRRCVANPSRCSATAARRGRSATSTTRCAASSPLLDGPHTGPINIGNPNEFTIRELAELAVEVTGSSSEIVDEPLPVDDPTQRQPDLTLARTLLRWEPTTSLRDGLERTADYFRKVLEV